ncbi:thioesterase family protein [Campylobacter sp. MIT 21-1685]|uniref:YbgC/FadM family acyl-CoA thioesterase n=1 Tax=unclassified Campylobacter TaxID=2593542 RepID=UPI00224AF729|nr:MULTISPECIES: thioesterase family protein [unclassified Campylobacter]MCX2683102.1 thioesterase family protein [Campylobacter sp. MIT 21-1684]MCX2751438.1 thioesterase family protein [Campylobacter sp. MIT 21-1682]MCX2807638.1 thioesterase family protein [Campylobacter sp. MIT 21-1685]
MKIRVYYEDTDSGGIVYHSNYLNFCERARSEIFFKENIDIFNAQLGSFVLTKANCEFLYSAKLGDLVEVTTRIVQLKNVSVILEQEITRENKKLFRAQFTLAFVKNAKPIKMPQEIKDLFEKLLI